jgi:hypothetical protein
MSVIEPASQTQGKVSTSAYGPNLAQNLYTQPDCVSIRYNPIGCLVYLTHPRGVRGTNGYNIDCESRHCDSRNISHVIHTKWHESHARPP